MWHELAKLSGSWQGAPFLTTRGRELDDGPARQGWAVWTGEPGWPTEKRVSVVGDGGRQLVTRPEFEGDHS